MGVERERRVCQGVDVGKGGVVPGLEKFLTKNWGKGILNNAGCWKEEALYYRHEYKSSARKYKQRSPSQNPGYLDVRCRLSPMCPNVLLRRYKDR